MKKAIAVLITPIFAMMILAEPLWALTTWSNPGTNPTTIPAGKAVYLFKGLSEIQKLKITCAIATTPSHSIFILPGEQFNEMTEENNGVKAFVCVGGIDTLYGQCWTVDNIEIIQFVACNNLAWRPICPTPPTPKIIPIAPKLASAPFPDTATDVFKNVPWPLWIVTLPAAGLYALGKFIFGSSSDSIPPPGSTTPAS